MRGGERRARGRKYLIEGVIIGEVRAAGRGWEEGRIDGREKKRSGRRRKAKLVRREMGSGTKRAKRLVAEAVGEERQEASAGERRRRAEREGEEGDEPARDLGLLALQRLDLVLLGRVVCVRRGAKGGKVSLPGARSSREGRRGGGRRTSHVRLVERVLRRLLEVLVHLVLCRARRCVSEGEVEGEEEREEREDARYWLRRRPGCSFLRIGSCSSL